MIEIFAIAVIFGLLAWFAADSIKRLQKRTQQERIEKALKEERDVMDAIKVMRLDDAEHVGARMGRACNALDRIGYYDDALFLEMAYCDRYVLLYMNRQRKLYGMDGGAA